MLRKVITVLAILLFSSPVFAWDETPNLDRRQANQDERIERGESSGSLTPREAGRIERGEAKLRRDEDRAKEDGVVTRSERRKLDAQAKRLNKQIFQQKHDSQVSE